MLYRWHELTSEQKASVAARVEAMFAEVALADIASAVRSGDPLRAMDLVGPLKTALRRARKVQEIETQIQALRQW